MTDAERKQLAAEIANAVWERSIPLPLDGKGYPARDHLNFIFNDAHGARALASLIANKPGVDVDEKALAAELAPLLTSTVGGFTDAALAQVKQAIVDEEAKRLGN